MKWLIIPVIIITLQGCAYTVVSTATYATTGKSVGDHVLTQTTGADCNTIKYILNKDRDYLCEEYDISKTYNRNAF